MKIFANRKQKVKQPLGISANDRWRLNQAGEKQNADKTSTGNTKRFACAPSASGA